jgi:hypothetical protein
MSETGRPLNKFAEALAEKYFCSVPEDLRRAPLRVPPAHGEAEDYYKVLAANLKAVQRYLDGTVPMPADLEEAWVETLPKAYRDRAVFDLCARLHVVPVLVSDDADIARLATFMEDEAAVIRAMAPILADGEIDEKDAKFIPEAIEKLRIAMADCAGLLQRLEQVSGSSPMVRVVGRR